jgi:hypothetical protein
MKIYRELVYHNLESFLLNCFPVTRKVLGRRRWDRLVRGFLSAHRCRTPYFRQIPDEFLQYLQEEPGAREGYPEFLLELAHYEWIELALTVSNRDEQAVAYHSDGDLIEGRPVLNPVLANLAYRWPVHQVAPRVRIAPRPTFLLAFRDAGYTVRFMEQSAVAGRLLGLLETGERTGREAVAQLAAELTPPEPAGLIGFARAHLLALKDAGAILGTRA